MHVRIPCASDSYYTQKNAENTVLESVTESCAKFNCKARDGNEYSVNITTDNADAYLDLNTLYRNVIKEAICADKKDVLSVMVKGGDWSMSTQSIDWALGILGYTSIEVPMRIFTPQILTDTGAKLSKSLIRDGDTSMSEVPEWMLDMGHFVDIHKDYANRIVQLVRAFLSHPRHMYRSYTYGEIVRLLQN